MQRHEHDYELNPLIWKRKHLNTCTLFNYVIEVSEKQDQALMTGLHRLIAACIIDQ